MNTDALKIVEPQPAALEGTQNTSPLQWLADAVTRHVVQRVAAFRRTTAEQSCDFDGMNETAAVVVLSKIFEGLGFDPYFEQKVYGESRARLDLWVGEPDGTPAWYLEAKIIWDGCDQRLNRARFLGNGEILGDLVRLSECEAEPAVRKVAVWIAFSDREAFAPIDSGTKALRLGDAISLVTSTLPSAKLASQRSVDLGRFANCVASARYLHVLCWTIE